MHDDPLGHAEAREGRLADPSRPETSYVFHPTRSRDQAGTTTLRTFIDRVFRGDALLLFQHLLEDEELSDQDLSALKKMLDQKRRKEGRHV